MYLFPRQFGLHNVFTSKIDHSKTSQKFPDYTLREEEISSVSKDRSIRAPKRLRGDVRRFVQRLQSLHSRCAYAELLRHYCPSAIDAKVRRPVAKNTMKQSQKFVASQAPGSSTLPVLPAGLPRRATQSRHKSRQPAPSTPVIKFDAITELATPTSHVSAFCQAVLAKIIPNEYWGVGESQSYNKRLILKKVDHFIKLRRFESMSLHEVSDGLKVSRHSWLPVNLR